MRLLTFQHGGDLGDTLAALPTIASLCGGDLCLTVNPTVREPYTAEKVARVQSFFEAQRCITKCYFANRPPVSTDFHVTILLDAWRKHSWHRCRNLADMCSNAFQAPRWPRDKPWLRVDEPNKVAEVVIHRSPRYQTLLFPWQQVVNVLGKRAVFVGSVEEHKDFTEKYGDIPHYPTPTLMDLARVIAGAEFYVGNQSAPLWIRTGLGLPLYCESHERHDNCRWERHNTFYGPKEWNKVQQFIGN
jgi:hypothetical protein